MRLALTCTVLAGLSGLTTAFGPKPFSSPRLTMTTMRRCSNTQLYSALGVELMEKQKNPPEFDPEKNIQAYLGDPDGYGFPREHLDGTAMVSGLVQRGKGDDLDRMDQLMFDLINDEESRYTFDKIVAFVDDEKYAKKIMISRKARYTGLLDVLDFAEASSPGALPTKEQLAGISTWVAYVEKDHMETLRQIVEYKNTVEGLYNVGVLMVNAQGLDYNEMNATMSQLTDPESGLTVLCLGTPTDTPEGQITYELSNAGLAEKGTLEADQSFSRPAAYNMMANMLSTKLTNATAFSVREVPPNIEELKPAVQEPNEDGIMIVKDSDEFISLTLIRGLRAAGYERVQEVEHMVDDGIQKYRDAVYYFQTSPYNRLKGTNYGNNVWEKDEFKNARNSWDERMKKKQEEAKREKEKARKMKIQDIAMEWGRRQYYQKELVGDTGMTEKEYLKSIWDEAVVEGERKYVELFGEDGTRDTRLEAWEATLKRKEEVAYEMAKKQLASVLMEEEANLPPPRVQEDDDDKEDDE